MIKIAKSTVIDRTIEEVFAFVADQTHLQNRDAADGLCRPSGATDCHKP